MSGTSSINHNGLKILVEADAVSRITAVANADKWSLTVTCGDTKKEVVAKNTGKVRVWRKLDTLAKYLQDLGFSSFETDVRHYDPSRKTLRRPDSAAALKRTHMAQRKLEQETGDASQDTQGLKKLNKASPAEVRESWEKRRARILQEANPRVK